jgi:hypothetical protein
VSIQQDTALLAEFTKRETMISLIAESVLAMPLPLFALHDYINPPHGSDKGERLPNLLLAVNG